MHMGSYELEPWSLDDYKNLLLCPGTWGQVGLSTDYISSCAGIPETDNHACFR